MPPCLMAWCRLELLAQATLWKLDPMVTLVNGRELDVFLRYQRNSAASHQVTCGGGAVCSPAIGGVATLTVPSANAASRLAAGCGLTP